METIFWISLIGTFYAYFLYPGVLALLGKIAAKPIRYAAERQALPSLSMIIPVHNEASVIEAKLANLQALDYPRESLKIIFIADACTDDTVAKIRAYPTDLPIEIDEIEERQGKAHGLNTGLKHVDTELVVFSDASIMLEVDALQQIVKPFEDPEVGCVSGEDHIAQGGGEGMYGQYELFLRNQESKLGSIVGASGSFYAQRAKLCSDFEPGLAPDFLSVLNTVEAGYRAITKPEARGHMEAVKSAGQEFQRKVRTLLRGMTAMFDRSRLLNPLTYGLFSFFLISHKLMRWLVPAFLLLILCSNLFLLDNIFYSVMLIGQVVFYLLATLAYLEKGPLHDSLPGRIPLFFVLVNVAIAVAWYRYLKGDRQELWTPSKRKDTESVSPS